MVSWPPGREGGDSGSGVTWRASPEDKLWQPPEQSVPCGLFFKSEDGGIWSTTGEVALEGEAVNCQLSQG